METHERELLKYINTEHKNPVILDIVCTNMSEKVPEDQSTVSIFFKTGGKVYLAMYLHKHGTEELEQSLKEHGKDIYEYYYKILETFGRTYDYFPECVGRDGKFYTFDLNSSTYNRTTINDFNKRTSMISNTMLNRNDFVPNKLFKSVQQCFSTPVRDFDGISPLYVNWITPTSFIHTDDGLAYVDICYFIICTEEGQPIYKGFK